MKYDYSTVFVAAPYFQPKKFHKSYVQEVNGVEFSRDVQNTILRMAENGYELYQNIPLVSSGYMHKTYTEGVTLIFRKDLSI